MLETLSLEHENARNIQCFFATQLPLLFIGESGTGKSHSASQIHGQSKNCEGQFLPLNCAGISENLAESTLFGSAEGAFTGAKNEIGYFGRAENGTIFLDEVGELSLSTQAKLLQVLSEGVYMRLGTSVIRHSNARVICATNVDLKEKVSKGSFREDLYYRISVLPVYLKPLRERRGEIPKLVVPFLIKHKRSISTKAMEFLMAQNWQGNIRQLFSCLDVACKIGICHALGIEDVRNAYSVVS